MGRPGISQEDVHQAATEIAATGETPTVTEIRRALGDTGSYSTISRYLGEWRVEHAERLQSVPEMPEEVERAFAGVWAAAWQETQRQIASERETLELARRQHEKEREELLAELDRLEGALDAAADHSKGLKRQLKEADNARAAAVSRANKHEVALGRAEERASGLERDVSRLEEQASGLRDELKQAQSDATDARAERDRLHQQLDAAREKIDALSEERDESRAALATARDRVHELEGDLRAAHADAKTKAAEAHQAGYKEGRADADGEIGELRGELRAAQERIEQLLEKLAQRQRAHEKIEQALEAKTKGAGRRKRRPPGKNGD